MVKSPLFPDYNTLTQLLKIIDGLYVSDFKNMWNSIWDLRGTPQKTVDWKEPDVWISERLEGKNREVAFKIWNESNKTLNPRWSRGSQFLMNTYDLIEDVNGKFKLTDDGKTFITRKENEIKKRIDSLEGLEFILLNLSTMDKGKRSDLLVSWSRYLIHNSNIKKDSVTKDYLRRRLGNLVSRGYVKREGNYYSITSNGEKYLNIYLKETQEFFESPTLVKENDLSIKINQFIREQRKFLREALEKTKPFQFEHVIKDLLNAMGYEDVEVTSATNDKGVDVTGISQNGITTVKEVIQVKRNTTSNISRTVLDSLRGSLHRFDAFQGTIITLSDFTKGAKDSAFEKSASPITLINGEKLIDLLIQYRIGVNEKQFDYYIIDNDYFNNEDEENLE